jgi:membrane-bound serine protease (ClpP class)
MTYGSIRSGLSGAGRGWGLFLALACLATREPSVSAQPAAADGLFVEVASPLTTEVYESVRLRVETARKNAARPPAKIVLDFTPNDKDANTTSFGACHDLASFLRDITDIPTVAYVHAKVTGFTVLPVLACQDVVVSSRASFGEIVPPGESLNASQTNAIQFLLGSHRAPQMAAIRKAYDPSIELLRGKDKNGGTVLVEAAKRAEAEKDGVTIADPTPIAFAPRGKTGLYTAKQAEELGLVRTRAENRNELAEKFGLNPLKLEGGADRPPLAFRYVLRAKGGIDHGVKESLLRSLRGVVQQKGTVVFLQIETGGGSLEAARDLAAELQTLQRAGEDSLKIVAFIPENAPDTAAVVALGCTDIVMSRRKDAAAGAAESAEATFGDFEAYLGKGKPDGNAKELIEKSLVTLAEEQGYSPLLVRGMVDANLTIVRARKVTDATIVRLMTAEELDTDKPNWKQERVVKPKGQLLKLSATEAEQLGLARFVVDGRDLDDVAIKYGFEPGKLREATPGSLDRFAEFLRIPAVTVLLVLIGFTGLILELKVPGTTVPGIVAALSFILLFWAHTAFSGQVAVLAGSIFILGLVLVLIEVFVIPGFGATGVLGILFMLSGLALATMDSVPQTAAGWGTFGIRASQFLFSMIGSVGLAFAIARFLPRIPYANRMLLIPPAERTDPMTELRETVAGAAQALDLIGAVGTAVTVLRPAGNVRFGDQFVDVVADGGYIPAGARVKVVLVEGNRIVVKEV